MRIRLFFVPQQVWRGGSPRTSTPTEEDGTSARIGGPGQAAAPTARNEASARIGGRSPVAPSIARRTPCKTTPGNARRYGHRRELAGGASPPRLEGGAPVCKLGRGDTACDHSVLPPRHSACGGRVVTVPLTQRGQRRATKGRPYGRGRDLARIAAQSSLIAGFTLKNCSIYMSIIN